MDFPRYRCGMEPPEAKSELLSQEYKQDTKHQDPFRLDEKKLQVAQVWQSPAQWPDGPLPAAKQIGDHVSRFVISENDMECAEYLLEDHEFQVVLHRLGVNATKDFSKLLFRPRHKRLVFEYYFDEDDPFEKPCGICDRKKSHKLIIEVTRRRRRILATCLGGPRTEVELGVYGGYWNQLTPGLNKIESKKAEFLKKAFRMSRDDSTSFAWDTYSVYDPYTFSDFIFELASFPHTSSDAILHYAATRINRVVAIIPPDTYNVKRNVDTALFYPGKGYPKMSARYTMEDEKKQKKRVVTLGANKIIEGLMAVGVLRIYKGKDVFADNKPPKDYLNVWTGLEVERTVKELGDGSRCITGDLSPLMDFLENWICSGDKMTFGAFMKWLIELMVRPWLKVPWAIWLYTSEKRMGKGLLCDFLYNFIFGSQTMKKFNGMSEVLHVHNAWCEGKKLVVVEECSSNKEEWLPGWDRIKGWAADRTINVHRKFENQYDAKSLLSFMIISNHRSSLMLEPGDRRYLCINPTDTKGSKRCAYFKDLQEKILTKEMARDFYSYCYKTTEFDYLDPYNTDPPLNILKEALLEENMQSEVLFLSEFCTMRWRIRMQETLKDFRKILPLLDAEKKRRARELEQKEEKDKEDDVLDFDPVDILLDDLECMEDTKEETDFLTRWKLKIKDYDADTLARAIENLSKQETVLVELIKKIGLPHQLDDRDEKLLAEAMEDLCKLGPVLTTEQLYQMYLRWFPRRISDGHGKQPAGKIIFGKKLAQCFKEKIRTNHLQSRLRSYNIDSIASMYIPFPEFETTMTYLQPHTEKVGPAKSSATY